MKASKKNAAHKQKSVVDQEVAEVKREWRNLRRFSDENRLLFAAFIIVLTALVVMNGIYIIAKNQEDSSTTVAVQANPNLVLDSTQTGVNPAIKVTISAVTENDEQDKAFPIDQNSTMLIMDITITNRSNQLQKLIPSNQLYVRSDDGDYAPMHPSLHVTNALATADMQPGQSVSGQISFEVPKRVASPILYIDTGWGNYVPILFDVLH